MYSKEFCDIYNEYGWDYFSLTIGKAILKYFENNNKPIRNHLDLGCGVGTLCDYFYKNKIKTTGIDISVDMINISKKKNKNIDFYVGDMTKYASSDKYDLITITCDAVNHILEEENLEILFSNIYKMLNDNGYLIFDIIDKNKLKLNSDIVSKRNEDVNVHYYITEKENLIKTNVKVIQRGNLIYEYDVLEKLYDIAIIKQLLFNLNYKIVKAENKIMKEEQRVEDKLYIICKKR